MPRNILDTVDIIKLGIELQAARKQAGFTQEEAAQIIGVARTTMTAIESGDRRIKEGELIKLATAYGRQLSDFLRPRPQIASFDVRKAQFRGSHLRTEEEMLVIEPYIYELYDLCRNYLELEQIEGEPLVRNYPPEYNVRGLPVEQAAEFVAQEERSRLRLGDGPLPVLRDLLEQDVGLRIFYLPLQLPSNLRFSAMYFYTEELGGCIAVNSNHPEDRRRLSLAHECGHFLTTRNKAEVFIENSYKRVPDVERFADRFAVYFLMPTTGLVKRFKDLCQAEDNQPSIGGLLTLANQYGVSFEALIRQLETLKLMHTGTFDMFHRGGIRIRDIQRRLKIGDIPARDDELPLRYQLLALHAMDKGRITEGQFARFMKLDRWKAREIVDELLARFKSHTSQEATDEVSSDNTSLEWLSK